MQNNRILVIGANGQYGTSLISALCHKYGHHNVVTIAIKLNGLNQQELDLAVKDCGITQIYLLADAGDENEQSTWNLNVKSLLSVLELAVNYKLDKVFWPSSTAVFGPGSPKYNCPQETRIQPNTVYGISKRTGEYWCNYYFEQFGLDVRSVRLPGLISHTTPAGENVTDYVADIFHHARKQQAYTCFLTEDNCLPMLYMPDAIRATMELMDAPKEAICIRTSYNVAGMSFAPCDLAALISKRMPGFRISYEPDHRNTIANNSPASIRDDQAQKDWRWKPAYDLETMTSELLLKQQVTEFYPNETF